MNSDRKRMEMKKQLRMEITAPVAVGWVRSLGILR